MNRVDMKKCLRKSSVIVLGMLLSPCLSHAQDLAQEMNSLHGVLDQLYEEMMPLCGKLISVGQGIAGFAALWYIASRVWRHIANAEPIDFYPLFRPFVLGFAILIFPSVLAMINGVMKPTVTATKAMVKGSNQAIAILLKEKEKRIKESDPWQMYVGADGSGNREKWYRYTHDDADSSGESLLDGIGNDIKFAMAKASYSFRNSVKEWMSEVLRVLFEAAALCINTLRTFNLIVLAILGPLVFGIAVFDGFQHTLTSWIARYINTFLWLPVANIFGSIIGKIQEKMLAMDIGQIQQQGDTFFSSTDVAYLVFLIIGIVGYFTVPSVAGYIVNAGGGGAMLQKVTTLMSGSVHTAGSMASSGASRVASGAGNIMNAGKQYNEGFSGTNEGTGRYASSGAAVGRAGAYMQDKLSGNS